MRLYRSESDVTHWYTFCRTGGWVRFPAEAEGWRRRQQAGIVNVGELREVPLRMGFNTGIPGAPRATHGMWDAPVAKVKSAA